MRKKGLLVGALVALFLGQGLVSQAMFPTWVKNYSSHNVGVAPGLSIDQLLASVAGLREMVAGILWVQSDEYFHTGQFDAILPVIRLVTWLDPRQIEVYSTGAWHIGYNFTDEQNRSDRRYIPLALQLLDEGVRNNPNTYELYYDTGWMYHQKIDDNHPAAVDWFKQALSKPDIETIPAIKSILSAAYIKNGQVEEALAHYWKLQQENQAEFDKTKNHEFWNRKDTQEQNVDNTIVRMASRGYFAKQDGVYDKLPYETKNPIDLNFTVKLTTVDPKVMQVTGTWGVPATGARIRLVIRDAHYNLEWKPAGSIDYEIDRDKTYLQELLYTQNGRFNQKLDMARNPTMYPFESEDVIVEFYFNPRSAPAHIQDRIGWNGEGMKDANFLNIEERPGTSILFAQFKLKRQDILQRGFSYSSPGYKEEGSSSEDDVIIQRSIRTK
ncbi:MAG: hypothetical protein M3R13_04455 [Armatimonadota bacterium]|nr:hypothetical protein [Armatimonadota bacterium]